MTCPRCQRPTLTKDRGCTACGYGLPGGDGVDRVTDGGVMGPLQDFVLRDPRTGRGVSTARSTRGARSTRSRTGGSPLLEFRQESSAGSMTRGTGARTRPRAARRVPHGSADLKKRPGHVQPEPTLGLDATDEAVGRQAATTRKAETLNLLGRRLVAGLIDMMILFGINTAVVYFTLRLASLPVALSSELPAGPLLAFLVLFDLGYLVVLTAFGGQTIGKMAVGLRVESGGGEPVTLLKSLVRTAGYTVSVLPLGAGFLLLLFRRRRTLHDLIADTRVVRVS